ncbi:MAG: hypothetical protein AB7I27_12300 [Bacteriovoracaceae bacterium]
MKTFLFILAFYTLHACASVGPTINSYPLTVSSAMTYNIRMPFFERNPALALNVEYQDVKRLRSEISKLIGRPLTFFKGWDEKGEAHVTTITPPEYNNQLKPYVSYEEISRIAQDHDIQSSDLRILGIGSGKKLFKGEMGETFFIIVESKRLLQIRNAIYQEYLKNNGPVNGPNAFNPNRFYPHITIGFTHDDIHENDGLIKDVQHSLDKRFSLRVVK